MRPDIPTITAVVMHEGATPGSREFHRLEIPDPKAIDAEFFVDDPARGVQMRPILKHEQIDRKFTPADRMIVTTAPGFHFRAFVRMRPGQRENTPRNVERAVKQVEKFDAASGLIFRRALQGVPPDVTMARWRKPFDQARPGTPGSD